MNIRITLKPGAKEAKLEKVAEGEYRASVKEPAKENKANFALLKLISVEFGVPLSRVRFVSGLTSRSKVIEVLK